MKKPISPKRFRKRPIEIVAVRVPIRLNWDRLDAITNWCGGTMQAVNVTDHYWGIDIPTLEGWVRARPGDWIIRGVAGEFYPCRSDIFKATYEPVPDTP